MASALMSHPLLDAEGPVGNQIISVEFEVYGQVQGVNFTKYAKDQAEALSLGGWVKNTKHGTVAGRLEGPKHKMDHMILWLKTEGSPGARIERVELRDWDFTAMPTYRNFRVRF